MQNSNISPLNKKKTSKITLIFLSALALLILYFAAAIGAALDISQDRFGKTNFNLFVSNIPTVAAVPSDVFSALGAGGYAPQMVFFAAVGIGIFALYKYSKIKKRLHRKGVEHGSAKWGV